jgi:hypothetical protein
VISINKSPLFFFFGGWCPNLTTLIYKSDGVFDKESNFEDKLSKNPPEKVLINIEIKSGLTNIIKCGIPEHLVATANLEWDLNGLFILKVAFSKDWDGSNDIGKETEEIEIKTICQNILYKEIKECHHIHTHHDQQEDGLLTLLFLGSSDTIHDLTLGSNGITDKIISHVYKQYSQEKPFKYTEKVKTMLEKTPNTNQLEEAIEILYKGIGEATYGLSFLGMYGSKVFTDVRINEEHIKLESAMRSLEVLKGRYTLDFMRRNRPHFNVSEIVSAITSGVTEAVLNALKKQ